MKNEDSKERKNKEGNDKKGVGIRVERKKYKKKNDARTENNRKEDKKVTNEGRKKNNRENNNYKEVRANVGKRKERNKH